MRSELLHPIPESGRNVAHGIHRAFLRLLSGKYALRVLLHLLLGLQHGHDVAAAMGMPPDELEVFRVASFQLVAMPVSGTPFSVWLLLSLISMPTTKSLFKC